MISPLIKEQTSETPLVILNPIENVFLFEGLSIPENAAEYYQDIIGWFTNFKNEPLKKFVVIFKIKYYNSASLTRITKVINIIDEIFKSGSEIKIIWYHHVYDEITKEDGLEFKRYSKVPFELISYE